MEQPSANVEFMTVDQVAQMLHLNPRTIRNRVRDHILPAKRFKGSKNLLIDKRDVMALLEDVGAETELAGLPRKNVVPPGVHPLEVSSGSGMIRRLRTPEDFERAIAVLNSFDDDDPEEQRETMEYLMRVLDEDRRSYRKLFPKP